MDRGIRYSFKPIRIVFDGTEENYEIEITGEILYFKSGDVELSVRLNERTADAFSLVKKQGVIMPFDRLFLTPDSAGTVVLHISSPRNILFFSNDVDVQNLEYDRSFFNDTLNNRTFIGNANPGAVAGQYSQVQLWNPATSGKNLIVYQVDVVNTAGANMVVYLGVNSTAFATASAHYGPKLAGGVTSSGSVRYLQDAVAAFSTVLNFVAVLNGDSKSLSFHRDAIVIPPGYGLVVRPTVVNQACGASFQWAEFDQP